MTEYDTILKKRQTKEKNYEDFLLDNINIISDNCQWGKIKRI